MSKTKKSRKSSDSESSEDSANSSSESAEEQEEKQERKKRKQKDKKKKKKHKAKTAKKKSKHNSESEKEQSSDSTDSAEDSSSSEDEKFIAKKKSKLREAKEKSPVRSRRDRSTAREREKQSGRSKWESPLRRGGRSRSRERHRNDRSRSRNRDRSYEHHRERHDERYRNNRDHRDGRSDIKREKDDKRDHRPTRDKDKQGGSYDRRDRSPKRERDRSRERNRDRDRDHDKREQRSPNRSRGSGNRFKNRRNNDDEGNNYEWGKTSDEKKTEESAEDAKDKEKPNFALSGALTEDTNKVNGVVVKYAEPPEARKPKRRWRLYPFKGETALPVLHIHRQSCFLVGRDRKVVDLAVDHPSCSKQHAALQYRLVPFEREDGSQGKRVRLYLIDLDSANGTFLNNKRVDARKYYELMEKDVVKFGFSTREYVLLHENSKEDQEDDDIDIKEEPVEN